MYSNENYLLDLLVEAGAIAPGTLDSVRAELSPVDSVIDYLIKNEYLTAEYIAQVAAYNSAMEYVDLNSFEVDSNIIASVSGELARRVGFLPIGDDGYSLQVAISDPFAKETLDSLPQFLGREITFFVASEVGLQKALAKYYPEKKAYAKGDGEAPIIELVDNMFNEAHEMRTSDIHIEPMEDRVRIRYRQPLQDATLIMRENGLYIIFDTPQRGITPGQFAVWYAPVEESLTTRAKDTSVEMLGSGVI